MNKTFPSPQEGPLQNKTQRATPNKGEKNMLWICMTVLDTFESQSRCSFRYWVPKNSEQDKLEVLV